MSDNITLNAGSGGATIATDDDTVAQHQYVKLEWGPDGTFTKVNTGAAAVPIQDGGNTITVDGTVAVTGVATEAKQPALGTAGTASADVITVQGIASMTALKVDGSAVTQPVSGTFWQATQPVSGTVAVTGVATAANQTTIIGHVDGIEGLLTTMDADTGALAACASGTELQVDIVSSALPSGAATAAKQPALGTAGTASADVITVQGIASMTALKVDGSAVTQPVSGTFWQATQPVSLATVPSHAVTNAGTFAVQVDGSALTALQLIDNPILVDDAAFTPATSSVSMAGFQADESSTDSVDEGDAGAARMTLDRKLITAPQPHSAGGLSIFRSLDLDETEEDIKTSAGCIYGAWVTNTATTTRWLKFYNATAANTTVGTTTPVITIGIPGNTSDDISANFGPGGMGIMFDTAICAAATTGVADADTGAPSANDLILNVFYK